MKKIQLVMVLLLAFGCLAQAQEDRSYTERFDFNKYKEAIQKQTYLRFYRSDEVVRYVDYAFVDVDHDGQSEVWLRGDDGQAWQGVFAIDGDSVVLLADADICSNIVFYENAVGYTGYISPGKVDAGFSVLKNSHVVTSAFMHKEFNIFSEEQEVFFEDYNVNGEYTDEENYNHLLEQLGERFEIEPVWYKIEQ